jgi:hypothetical protein
MWTSKREADHGILSPRAQYLHYHSILSWPCGAANLCEVACRELVDVARLLADDFLGICFEDFAQIVWNIYLLCAIHWLCVESHGGWRLTERKTMGKKNKKNPKKT